MRMSSVCGVGFLLFFGAFSSVGCATAGSGGGEALALHRVQARLSDFTLSYDLPSLKPSKDFPRPKIVDHLDLDHLTESRFVLHGYWDGPTHQLLSTTGTLHIWLDVRPWPAAAASLEGCDAKARAFVEEKFASELSFFERGYIEEKPVQKVSGFVIRGATGLKFESSFRRTSVGYVIPLNADHFLYLVLESANNSDPSSGWPELSAMEQDKFLRSLELEGPVADCR